MDMGKSVHLKSMAFWCSWALETYGMSDLEVFCHLLAVDLQEVITSHSLDSRTHVLSGCIVLSWVVRWCWGRVRPGCLSVQKGEEGESRTQIGTGATQTSQEGRKSEI